MDDEKYGKALRSRSRSPERAIKYVYYEPVKHSSGGQYIAVENTSLIYDINISAWKVEHIVNGVLDAMFAFPSGRIILRPKQTIKIWGNAYRYLASLYDFVCDTYSRFGVGYETQTVVLNQFREEVARFIRRGRSSSPRYWIDRGVDIYDSVVTCDRKVRSEKCSHHSTQLVELNNLKHLIKTRNARNFDFDFEFKISAPLIKTVNLVGDEICTGETTATVRFRIRRRDGVTFTPPIGNQYVIIENRNYFEVDISRWRIEEIVNGNYRGQFVFPEGTTLLPREEVKASS
ncbi:hypothetical protein WR25_13210 [Diploscapter pachys]|uniref:LTD domain-containing protein n=1 Tax=Diploscapter pachys TaxID=2018661 RepID=A0A2A2L589_9BILA|nr:hypothetical protein WR25_13210 [Diploscapter pachys]